MLQSRLSYHTPLRVILFGRQTEHRTRTDRHLPILSRAVSQPLPDNDTQILVIVLSG